MKRLSWKYIAGFVDGEGCIDLQITKYRGESHRNYYYVRPRLRVCLASNAKEVLDILQTNFKGTMQHRESKNERWSDSYSWELVGYNLACPVLRNIANHLIIKKEQARLCLWMETNVKSQKLSEETVDLVRSEFKAMKRDPHRLSELAQENILRCDSRASDLLVGNMADRG